MLRRLRICAPVGLSLLLLPAMAYALDGKIDGKPVPEWQVAVDTVWTIVAGILVFLMQAGFAMVEGGFTRAKNVANIMMKNIGDFSMASLGFWILGFGIMFGNGNSFLGTTGFFVAAGTGDLYSSLSWTSVPTLTAWFFQLVFCATAATIVSGAMAERTRFSAYLIFSFIISLIFYPMVGHWIWGGGWLAELGMLDFAGSTVVHSTGAWFALAGVIVLGPRLGRYSPAGRPLAIPGHNLLMVLVRIQHTMGAAVNDISGVLRSSVSAWFGFGKHHGRGRQRYFAPHGRHRFHQPGGARRRWGRSERERVVALIVWGRRSSGRGQLAGGPGTVSQIRQATNWRRCPGALDLTSVYQGRCCPLARHGHSRVQGPSGWPSACVSSSKVVHRASKHP